MPLGDLFNMFSVGDATAKATRRIREWARTALHATPNDVITVSELRCGETDCPDLETLVILTPEAGPRRLLKIAKPATTVTETDLYTAIARATAHKE